jgi:hypothetical protein
LNWQQFAELPKLIGLFGRTGVRRKVVLGLYRTLEAPIGILDRVMYVPLSRLQIGSTDRNVGRGHVCASEPRMSRRKWR